MPQRNPLATPGSKSLDRPWHLFGRALLVFVLLFTALVPSYSGLSLPILGSTTNNALAAASDIVISQVYGGGGSTNATHRNDFVEIFNRGNNPVSISAWSIQYASATGTGGFGGSDVQITEIPVGTTLNPGKYLLIRGDSSGSNGTILTADVTDTGPINLSATGGKVVLVKDSTPLGCNGGSTACNTDQLARIADLVGYGTANFSETAPVGALSVGTSAQRNGSGCTDTDNNSNDFTIATPNPRNSSTPTATCGTPANNPPTITAPANPITTVQQDAAPFTVSLSGSDDNNAFTWSATAGVGIASVTVASGQGTNTVGYQVTLQAGFTGTASFTATLSDGINPAVNQTVNIQVNGNTPNLAVNPTSLNFSATQGGPDPANQSIQISSTISSVPFTAVATTNTGGNWLGLLPANPTNGNTPATVTATATLGALGAGTYTGTVTVTNTNNLADVKAIPVTLTVSAAVVITRIHTIQGNGGLGQQWKSPLEGQTGVTTEGVVTAKRSNGFWLQDPNPDGDPNTSEGIFVFSTNTTFLATAQEGRLVRVTGRVTEFRQFSPTACAADTKPTITEIDQVASVTDIGAGTITPTVLSYNRTGPNIRQIPTQTIYSTPGANQEDGIDFWESLEGMLVQVDDALVIGPSDTNGTSFHTAFVLADNGAGATISGTVGLNQRKSLALSPTDFNPERILLVLPVPGPYLSTGDKFTAPLVGNVDIDCFTSPAIKLKTTVNAGSIDTAGRVAREVLPTLTNPDHLRVSNMNVENLGGNSPQAKFDALADQIVNNLKTPDIITLEEVQDDNGATNDAVVTADLTLNKLRQAVFIKSSSVISYSFAYISPLDDTNGGQPGGNIRVAFFYRTDRGLSFVNKPGGDAITANTILPDGSLQFSPGLISPTNTAFNSSRKPLAGEFNFKGQRLIVIGNHWNSKGGDNGLYGLAQPPVLSSEVQRNQQATIVRGFINDIQAANPGANIVVNGDLNDFEFSNPLNIVKTGPTSAGNLINGIETIPLTADRYTYKFEGNAQSLDHALYSQPLASRVVEVDAVHINADYATTDPLRASDHDPVTVVFNFGGCANPLLVTKNADDGTFESDADCGSLSYAINAANSSPSAGPVVISFTNTITQITLTGVGLPVLNRVSPTSPLVLNAGCEVGVGGRGVPKVQLTTSAAITIGFTLGNNVALGGFKITGFSGEGIRVTGSGNNIGCNWIGTTDGVTALPNGVGIHIMSGASGNSLGAVAAGQFSGNLISGNTGVGLLVEGKPNNMAYYNLIGYTADGTTALPNLGGGLKVLGGQLIMGLGNRIRR